MLLYFIRSSSAVSNPFTRLLANFNSTLNDTSQYTYPSTIIGNESYGSGAFGTVGDSAYSGSGDVRFNMGNDLVDFLNQPQWTIEFFLKLTNTSQSRPILLVGQHNGAGYHPIQMYYYNNGRIGIHQTLHHQVLHSNCIYV